MRRRHIRRAARNAAVALLLAGLLWAVKGYPLPTMELELHRAERQHMVEESQVIWRYEGRAYHDRSMLVGLGPLYISTYSEAGQFCLWPRSGDSPTLVQLPESTRYSPQGTFHSYQDPAFLLIDAPARAQSARLHLRLTHNGFDQVYTMEGQKQGSVWFFQLEKQHYADGDSQRSTEETAFSTLWSTTPTQFYCPCTVELFDNEGALLDRLDVNGGCDRG